MVLMEKYFRIRWLGVFFTAVFFFAGPGFAQTSPLPGGADPARALQSLEIMPGPDTRLEQEQAPTRRAVYIAPPGAENMTFVLHDVYVENMTAYEPWEIEKIYAGHLGKEILVATMFEIMAAIQQKYLDDGYALTKVTIPNQKIEDGFIRFSVTEGFVAAVEFAGNIQKTSAILDAAERIKAMRPLNVRGLERIMLILNDLPGHSVGAILASPQHDNAQGGIRVILEGRDSPRVSGNVGINNHGSAFTGPWQATATARGFDVGLAHSMLEVTALGSLPLQEQRIVQIGYKFPLFGASGTILSLTASKARTEPGS